MSIDSRRIAVYASRREHWTVWLGCFTLAVLLGCGASDRNQDRKAVYPVAGQFLVNGAPAGGARVTFHPIGGTGPGRAFSSRGRADSDGKFQLTTYVTADGAPEGEYIVTVYWPAARPASTTHEEEDDELEELPPDRLGNRFRSPGQSKLRARVAAHPTAFAPQDLAAPDVGQGSEVQLRVE